MTLSSRPALRRDLDYVYREGIAWSLMVGLGETWFPAFALSVGVGEVWAGLLSTVPLFAGGFLQLFTPWGVTRLRSRRKWSMLCAATQAVSFLPLVVAAALGRIPGYLLLMVATVYWAAGLAAGPSWNAWMTRVVPSRLRARYFARRSRATQFGVLLGLLLGGVTLQVLGQGSHLGFFIIFTLGAVARAVSSRYLAATSESQPPLAGERLVIGRELVRRFTRGRDGRFILFLILMTAAVSVASPFFTPYMLRPLGFSYVEYMTLIAASFAAKAAVLSVLGRLARRVSAARILRTSAIIVSLLPVFWLLGDTVPYLFVLQVAAGTFWGAYEFSAFLLYFDRIREEERTSLLTTLNLANAAAMAGGSILGGVVLSAAAPGRAGYHELFLISAAARLVVLLALARLGIGRVPVPAVSFRTLGLRPSLGGLIRPISAGFADPRRRRRPPDTKDR